MRSLMVLAAVAVAGTWIVAKHLPHGEARAQVVEKQDVRTQEIVSVAIDTPASARHERRLPLAELRESLSSKPGAMLDDSKLEADRKALEATLAARGFLAAKVAPATVTFSKTGGAYVVFDVDRGPMFHLRSIKVTGPGQQEDVVRLSPGDEALPARLERARASLAEVLKSNVELHVQHDVATATVDVVLATN